MDRVSWNSITCTGDVLWKGETMSSNDIEKDYTAILQISAGYERYKQEEQRKSEQFTSAKSLLSSVLVFFSATIVIIGAIIDNSTLIDVCLRVLIVKMLLLQIASVFTASFVVFLRRQEFYTSTPDEIGKEVRQREKMDLRDYQETTVSNYQKKIEMLRKANDTRTCLLDWALGTMLGSVVLALVISIVILYGGFSI